MSVRWSHLLCSFAVACCTFGLLTAVSCLWYSVRFLTQGWKRESDSSNELPSSFLLAPLPSPLHRPYASIFSLFFVFIWCAWNNIYIRRAVFSVQRVSVPLQHVCSYCRLSLPFPYFLSHASEHLSFVLLRFSFFSIRLYTCSLLVLLFIGLACFVVFLYWVRYRFAWFALKNCDCLVFICFTVGDRIICIILTWTIGTDSACIGVVR